MNSNQKINMNFNQKKSQHEFKPKINMNLNQKVNMNSNQKSTWI